VRYFGGAVAFGFAALWIMASLAAALTCALAAVAGYGVMFAAECGWAKLATRRLARRRRSRDLPSRPAEVSGLPNWADALNSDLGYVYEPAAAMLPLSGEAAYGWPLDDGATAVGDPLH
jgi:hypothetical protein